MQDKKDKRINFRLSEEEKEKLDNIVEEKDAGSKSELLRRWIRKEETPRNMRIESLKNEIEEIEQRKQEKKRELRKLKEERDEVLETYERIRPDIKEYLLEIFKEAERKNEPLKYRKEGLVEFDLRDRFGIVWDNESKALELMRACDPITYKEIEPDIEELLDSFIDEGVIRDVRKDELGTTEVKE